MIMTVNISDNGFFIIITIMMLILMTICNNNGETIMICIVRWWRWFHCGKDCWRRGWWLSQLLLFLMIDDLWWWCHTTQGEGQSQAGHGRCPMYQLRDLFLIPSLSLWSSFSPPATTFSSWAQTCVLHSKKVRILFCLSI